MHMYIAEKGRNFVLCTTEYHQQVVYVYRVYIDNNLPLSHYVTHSQTHWAGCSFTSFYVLSCWACHAFGDAHIEISTEHKWQQIIRKPFQWDIVREKVQKCLYSIKVFGRVFCWVPLLLLPLLRLPLLLLLLLNCYHSEATFLNNTHIHLALWMNESLCVYVCYRLDVFARRISRTTHPSGFTLFVCAFVYCAVVSCSLLFLRLKYSEVFTVRLGDCRNFAMLDIPRMVQSSVCDTLSVFYALAFIDSDHYFILLLLFLSPTSLHTDNLFRYLSFYAFSYVRIEWHAFETAWLLHTHQNGRLQNQFSIMIMNTVAVTWYCCSTFSFIS